MNLNEQDTQPPQEYYIRIRKGKLERVKANWKTIHGMAGTHIYRVWNGMHQRCENQKCREYPLYGARGIKVCDRWREFANFLLDMGNRPETDRPRGIQIERIDNDGDYEPNNCRWATPKEQAKNRRQNPLYKVTPEIAREIRKLVADGESKPNIALRFGLGWRTVYRIAAGHKYLFD